jgi:SWIM zinc finger
MTASIVPSAAQRANAARQLERAAEWRTVRIDGVRYVILASATSGHTYTVRADAAGCSCPWYAKTERPCSHMVAVKLAAPTVTISPYARYGDLFPSCAATGCQDDPEPRSRYCHRHVLVDAF